MTPDPRFLSGFATGYAHLIAATIAGLWLTPFFLRHLGQSTYGLWLVGTQVIAYLLLMDLGIVALLPRETAYVTGRTGRHDAPELRQLIEKTLTLACVQTPVVLSPRWSRCGGCPRRGQRCEFRSPSCWAVFVLTFPLRVFQAALTGLQDLAFVARTQFVAWLAGTRQRRAGPAGVHAVGAGGRVVRDAGDRSSRRHAPRDAPFPARCRAGSLRRASHRATTSCGRSGYR